VSVVFNAAALPGEAICESDQRKVTNGVRLLLPVNKNAGHISEHIYNMRRISNRINLLRF